ncbi:MAG: cold shock domain-containing protein [Thermodesulfobacteriota bacterium]
MELQIEGRNVDVRNSWQEKINEEKERLGRHHPGLVHHLRVAIGETAGHKSGGFEVRVVAAVPNDTIVVTRKGESVRPLLVEAFDTLGQLLKELQRKRRQTHKVQEEAGAGPLAGKVKSLFPEEAYGFIATPEGEEVYFHENALKDLAMEQLREGAAVLFGLGEGDKGPTAAWVRAGK